MAKDRVWYFAMLFLCSALRLVLLWYLQLSHMDHGPTLEKSHVLWGNPYAPGDDLILVGDRGHAILWYTISVQFCTHHQWSWLRCQAHPGENVMFHSLQCSPSVPLAAQGNRARGDFSAEAHYGLSHRGKEPNTTGSSRWNKGKANINSYDYSLFQCSAMICHVSCVAFWAHKIMSCMQSSATPAQYWHFLRLINYESTDPWYSIWHLLFPPYGQFPCSINRELSVLLQRIFCECACG